MKRILFQLAFVAALPLTLGQQANADELRRITNLYDAFGAPSALQQDWGFAALIEYGGKRILFDTGNDAAIFEHNVKQLGIDLGRLDAVIISHRHGDHTSGLKYLLEVNPHVKVYAPMEGAFFSSVPPPGFLARTPGLPPNLQYYGGNRRSGGRLERHGSRRRSRASQGIPRSFPVSTSSRPNRRSRAHWR